jgi:hypothetical protein
MGYLNNEQVQAWMDIKHELKGRPHLIAYIKQMAWFAAKEACRIDATDRIVKREQIDQYMEEELGLKE